MIEEVSAAVARVDLFEHEFRYVNMNYDLAFS